MKNQIVRGLPLAALLALTTSAHAQYVVSYFNFNGLTSGSAVTVGSITPNAGTGTLSSNFNGNGFSAFAGSTLNAQGSDPAGQALALLGGSSGSGAPNNGKYLQLQTSTLSYKDITLSFATQGTSTGFNSVNFSFSTDGTTFVDYAPAAYIPPASYGVQTINLAGISLLNNKPAVYFRFVFNGGSSGTGSNRIDNLKVTAATPAPSSALVALFGAGPLAVALRRRRK